MTTVDDSTPLLVGVGVVQQKLEDPSQANEAVVLMIEAARAAAKDSGALDSTALMGELERIAVPRGLWGYSDPARLVARAIGAESATTVLVDLGILQQSLLGDACQRIQQGEIELAMVVGGEAKYRGLRSQITGVPVAETTQTEAPDVFLKPAAELFLDAEVNSGLGHMPVGYYAILESAFRAAKGWTIAEHLDQLAKLYSDWSAISCDNPHAWKPGRVSMEEIRNASARNPMLAFPYTKLHNTSWNVDQAAALIFCSARKARQLGIDPARWIFPHASTESNHMLCASQKPDLGRLPGARIAGHRALEIAGLQAGELDFIELYSCFPVAVEIYADELGLPANKPWTVTGGMPFAGGPLNNFVLQASCRMAEKLRAAPDCTGLVTSVSGLMTKQGFGIWGSKPAADRFAYEDVSELVRAQVVAKQVLPEFTGSGVIAGYTVLYQSGQATRAIAVLDLADDRRTVGWNDDPAVMSDMQQREYVGRQVTLGGGQFSLKA